MKKKIAYALLTFMSLSFLAGCVTSGDNSSNDPSSGASKTYTYREEVSKEPTCEKDGVKSFICNEDASKSYTEKIPALGHLYNVETLEFVWVDYESASVTTDCTRCHKTQKFDASITSEVKTEPTCTNPGEKEYTATVTIDNKTYSDVKKETLTSSHIYTKVDEKSFAPTYATDGKLVERCDKCNDEKDTPITKQRDNLVDYGDETNPYLIATLTDWNAFASDASTNTFEGKFIKVINDIGTAEAPITTLVNNYVNGTMYAFAGTLLGNDKTFYVNLAARPNGRTALFAFASNATFKDLTINGVVGLDENNAGKTIASALVADGSKTITIDNCINNAEVYASDTAGGFVGYPRGGCALSITSSKNTGNIYASGDYAGGFVGNGKVGKSITLDNCINEGVISAKANYLDQFIGASKADDSVVVNENCQKNGHAYLHSTKTVDETGHYYPCIEEGCTEKIELEEHNFTFVPAVPATCAQTGTKEHYACDECDKKFIKVNDEYTIATEDSLIIPLVPHTYKSVSEIPATCQSTGTRAHYVCEECNATFLLNDGVYTPATADDLLIKKTDHIYNENYESDKDGHWQKCTICDEESEHVAHTKDYEDVTTEHGITCTVCGYVIAEAHVHTYGEEVTESKASYATAGQVAYVPCTECDAKFTPDTHELLSLDELTIKPQKEVTDKGYGDTEDNPYLIANVTDYNALLEDVNSGTTFEGKFFKMTADISQAIENRIGTSSTNCFKGAFDGDGHSVELNINATSAGFGMFGYTNGATIKNVITKGSLKTKVGDKTANAAGALIGNATATKITDCTNYVDVTIEGGIGDVGGIAGVISGNYEISGCKNFGSINATCSTAKYVGGIVGDVKGSGTITNCVNGYETLPSGVEQGTISNISSYAGGIVGGTQAKITISGCTNFMDISSSIASSTGLGGIIGLINATANGSSTIENSINKGIIEGLSSIGGIVGRLAAPTKTSSPFLALTNCKNEGDVKIGEVSATQNVGTKNPDVPGMLIGSVGGSTDTYIITNE